MKMRFRILSFFVAASLFPITTVAQRNAVPELLTDAAYCLVTEKHDWLGVAKTKMPKVQMSFMVDTTSFPGEKHLVVVSFDGPRSGRVFDIKLSNHRGKTIFKIENNAKFVYSRESSKFTEPPLGGVWTTERLQSAISKIRAGKRKYDLSISELLASSRKLECTSYASDK
jgi:hypothetical protein